MAAAICSCSMPTRAPSRAPPFADDTLDTAIAFPRIVITGIYHHDVVRYACEKILRQFRDSGLLNGHHYNVARTRCFVRSHGGRAGLCRHVCQRLGPAGVGDKYLMTQLGKTTSQRAADLSRTNDAYFHDHSSYAKGL
jgi:hypothetical protein